MKNEKIAGAIVNISSINPTSYCQYTGVLRVKRWNKSTHKAAALALAPYGIRVNAVGPGSIDTAMLAGVNADDEKSENGVITNPTWPAWQFRRCSQCRCVWPVIITFTSPAKPFISMVVGLLELCLLEAKSCGQLVN